MQNADNLFAGCRVKVSRARAIGWEIVVEIDKYIKLLNSRMDHQLVEEDLYEVVFRVDKNIPHSISVKVAEIIYHLRSALDQMVYAVAENVEASIDHVEFPFCSSEKEFFEKKNARKTRGLPKEFVEYLFSLKPWNGGNQLLYDFGKLANVDKHRKMIRASGQISGFGFYDGSINYANHPRSKALGWELGGDLYEGIPIVRYGKGGHFNGKVNVELVVTFAPQVGYFINQPAVSVLFSIIDAVEKIIEGAEKIMSETEKKGEV